jgi:tetratricopeptide (TPR) repeat protein
MTDSAPGSSARSGRWIALAMIALAMAAAGWLVDRSMPSTTPPPAAAAPMPLVEALDRSLGRQPARAGPGLAVRVPLTAADDPELTALGQSLCQLAATRLRGLGGLRVAACESTRTALVAGLDDVSLARLLAVDHLVTSRIERAPEGRLHLRMDLLQLPSGRRLWTLATTIAPAELQAAAQQLAQHVAGRLGLGGALPPEPEARPEVFDRLLQAQRVAARGTPDDQREALRLVDEALALQPRLTSARLMQLGLRNTVLRFPSAAEQADPPTQRRRMAALMVDAETLGRELLADGPSDPRGHVLLAHLAVQQRRWSEGFVLLDRALASPRIDPASLRTAAHLHAMAGYRQQALELALAAARLDPLNAVNHQALAFFHGLLGDDARMREHAGIAQELGDRMAVVYQGIAALRAGEWAQAEAATVEGLRGAGVAHGWVADFVRGAADPAQREAAAAAIAALPAPLQHGMANFHWYLAWLGDVPRTLQAVHGNLQGPIGAWLSNLWWPEFGSLRQADGFAAVLADTGLPGLWAVRGAPPGCTTLATGRWACR